MDIRTRIVINQFSGVGVLVHKATKARSEIKLALYLQTLGTWSKKEYVNYLNQETI